ncbi:MAG: hypothetical protein ACRDRO_16030 [Pseudonocardiaceae bacterium]
MRDAGYSAAAIKTLWDILLPFSDYAFNRAHAAGYGLVSYWTAYLKANYRSEYMAALLTSVGDDKDKAAIYLAECRKMGITVLPPDVNSSERDFVAVGKDVRCGLGAIRNVGGNVVDAITRARTEKGSYTDFSDFLRKVGAVACNRKVVESLVKAGASFDSLGHPRKGLYLVHAEAIDVVRDSKLAEAIGQFDLFGEPQRRAVGGRPARGSRRRNRGALLSQDLLSRRGERRRGPHRAGQGPGNQTRRPDLADRQRPRGSRPRPAQ